MCGKNGVFAFMYFPMYQCTKMCLKFVSELNLVVLLFENAQNIHKKSFSSASLICPARIMARPQGYKTFSCSTQMSVNAKLLINDKLARIN